MSPCQAARSLSPPRRRSPRPSRRPWRPRRRPRLPPPRSPPMVSRKTRPSGCSTFSRASRRCPRPAMAGPCSTRTARCIT
ncbi:hypothetical protein AL509_28655 [Achromobacter xylosoxidans]|nr:hypothetical protein AL509_28655 [Achromobacter xylosoxidans]